MPPTEDAAAEDSGDEGPAFTFVRKKYLEELKATIKDGKEVTTATLTALLDFEQVGDEETMVPIMMPTVDGKDIDLMDAEESIKTHTAKAVAEACIKAEELMVADQKDKPEGPDKLEPMTGKEWKENMEAISDFSEMGVQRERCSNLYIAFRFQNTELWVQQTTTLNVDTDGRDR